MMQTQRVFTQSSAARKRVSNKAQSKRRHQRNGKFVTETRRVRGAGCSGSYAQRTHGATAGASATLLLRIDEDPVGNTWVACGRRITE